MTKFFKGIFLIWWIPTLWGMMLIHVCLSMFGNMGSSGDGKPYDASSFFNKAMAFLVVVFIEFALLDICLVSLSGKMGFEYTSLLK